MAEYIAAFAPESMPDIQYLRVDREQADCIERAMRLADNQASFEVTFLPVETPEQRLAAAEEWAGYKQAKGCMDTKARGAVLFVNGKDESPEALLDLLEDKDNEEVEIPYAPWVTHALVKIVKLDGTSSYRLFREYYDAPEL